MYILLNLLLALRNKLMLRHLRKCVALYFFFFKKKDEKKLYTAYTRVFLLCSQALNLHSLIPRKNKHRPIRESIRKKHKKKARVNPSGAIFECQLIQKVLMVIFSYL